MLWELPELKVSNTQIHTTQLLITTCPTCREHEGRPPGCWTLPYLPHPSGPLVSTQESHQQRDLPGPGVCSLLGHCCRHLLHLCWLPLNLKRRGVKTAGAAEQATLYPACPPPLSLLDTLSSLVLAKCWPCVAATRKLNLAWKSLGPLHLTKAQA